MWKHHENSQPKKFQAALLAGMQMAIFFWNVEGIPPAE
jgi:hypothetical protein